MQALERSSSNGGESSEYWHSTTTIDFNELTTPSSQSYAGKPFDFEVYGIGGVTQLPPSITLSVGGDGLSETIVDFAFSLPTDGVGLLLHPHKTIAAALTTPPPAAASGSRPAARRRR